MAPILLLCGSARVWPRCETLRNGRRSFPLQAVARAPIKADESAEISGLEKLLRRTAAKRMHLIGLKFSEDHSQLQAASSLRTAKSDNKSPSSLSASFRSLVSIELPDDISGSSVEIVDEYNEDEDDEAAAAATADPSAFVSALRRSRKKKQQKSSTTFLPAPLQAILDKIMEKVPARVRGLIMLNLLVVMVATNWVILKEEGAHFDPYVFASLRFGVAALALTPFIIKAKKATWLAGLELGVYTAIGYLSQSEGLLTTDASRASFLSTFTVLVVPFLAGLDGRSVKPLTWAAATAALVGVSLLETSGSAPSIGDVWSIVSAVAFGVQIYRTEHWSRLLGSKQTVPLISVVLAVTAVLATLTAGVSHPEFVQAAVTHPVATFTDAAAGTPVPWLPILYTSLLTTDVALMLEFLALRNVPSTEAAIIYTLEPVLGAGMAFAFLGEKWGPTGWVGAAIIISSCLAMQVFGKDDGSGGGGGPALAESVDDL